MHYKPDEPFETNTHQDPTDLDKLVKLMKLVVIPTFGLCIMKGHTEEMMMMDQKLKVITQAPYPEDNANLPVGMYVLRNYTKMKDGGQIVHLVLRNGTSCPIRISGGWVIRKVISANLVPMAEASPKLLKELNRKEELKEPKLMIPEKQA